MWNNERIKITKFQTNWNIKVEYVSNFEDIIIYSILYRCEMLRHWKQYNC